MKSLSDALNKVSRLVTPELREEDAQKRINAEIKACEDFLAEKQAVQENLARAKAECEAYRAAAKSGQAELDALSIKDLAKTAADIKAAAELLDRQLGFSRMAEYAAIDTFCRNVRYDLTSVAMTLMTNDRLSQKISLRMLTDHHSNRNCDDLLRAHGQAAAGLEALRRAFAEGISPQSPLGKKLFFTEKVIGEKTERRAGYPLVFLTEKVKVPVTKTVELTAEEKAGVTARYLSAVTCLQNDLPVFLVQRQKIAEAMKSVSLYEDASQRAASLEAELARVPADMEQKAQAFITEMKKASTVPVLKLK